MTVRRLSLGSRLSDRVEEQRHNNFDFIRWLAATLVIISHEYAIHSRSDSEPLAALTHGFITFGALGVDVFFVISGFLVVRSMLERQSLAFFASSRVLRLAPGLSVALIFSAFVLGPLLTSLPIWTYFSRGDVYSYVFNNLVLVRSQWDLPGLFSHNPIPDVVNGSLWSLWPEAQMYVLVFVLGAGSLLVTQPRRPHVLGVGLAVAMVIALAVRTDLSGHLLEPDRASRLIPYFSLGGLLFIARHWLPTSAALPLLTAVFALVCWQTPAFVPLFNLALAAFVVWLAYTPLGWLSRWGKTGDFSYGLYIYAFPIQQAAVVLLPNSSRLAHFLCAYLVTTALAMGSWRFIEQPSLALKRNIAISSHRQAP